MKAVIWTKYGPPDVLHLREIEKPIPKDDEVLVKIIATSVFAGDCEMRRFDFPISFWLPLRLMFGLFKPRVKILGQELAGEIEAVGKEVKQFRSGDQIFAPTDAAFAELGLTPDNIDDLDQETLSEILAYHVIKGRLLAEDVVASSKLNTLIRGKAGFVAQDGGVLTDNTGRNATIIITDVVASNGVIHAIDAVILPN